MFVISRASPPSKAPFTATFFFKVLLFCRGKAMGESKVAKAWTFMIAHKILVSFFQKAKLRCLCWRPTKHICCKAGLNRVRTHKSSPRVPSCSRSGLHLIAAGTRTSREVRVAPEVFIRSPGSLLFESWCLMSYRPNMGAIF